MNILHLLSQTQLTGAEVYAAQLINRQRKTHRCFVISDTLNVTVDADYKRLSIDNRTLVSRIKNALCLLQFCRQQHIDVIHSHSRAASWLAHYISSLLSIIHVATVHGIQGVHFSSKHHNIYGRRIIAVCEFIKEHLISDLNIADANISLIRNGFDAVYQPAAPALTRVHKMAWVGRLTGPKGEAIKQLMQQVFSAFPQIKFYCFGGPNTYRAMFQNKAPPNCFFVGQAEDLNSALADFPVVFASGRAAVEALFQHKAVYAVGEAFAVGFVSDKTARLCRSSNFGDCGAAKMLQPAQVITDIKNFLHNPKVPNYQTLLRDYQMEAVYPQVMALYQPQADV